MPVHRIAARHDLGAVTIDTIGALGLSLALGLLIGIQRGWALRNEQPGSRFPGIRTFGLLGMAGGLAGAIHPGDAIVAAVIVAGAAALVLLG